MTDLATTPRPPALTQTPLFDANELSHPEFLFNRQFLRDLEAQARRLPVFDHPFLARLAHGGCSVPGARFALIQFAKHVRIFTSCLAHLLGKAPDIRDRIVLFDNLREELGGGTLGDAHYMLYMRMLDSIGISADEVARTRALTTVELLNDGLHCAIDRSFQAGLSWLGIGGELTIPNNFPYLAQGIRRLFPAADMHFFERHGTPDEAHNDDSNLLLALHLHGDDDRHRARAEVHKSLFLRAAVWDEIGECASRM